MQLPQITVKRIAITVGVIIAIAAIVFSLIVLLNMQRAKYFQAGYNQALTQVSAAIIQKGEVTIEGEPLKEPMTIVKKQQ